MSRGGRARGSKRKRNWDIEDSSFLEERPQQLRRASVKKLETAVSLSKAWLKCGEGFLDSSEILPLVSEKATVTEKQLELSPRPKKETASESINELANITWSSSSDEDKTFSKSQQEKGHGCRTDRFCNRATLCPEDGASEDELQFIDWEINSDSEDADEHSECEGDEAIMDISDCASCASSHSLTSDDRLCQLPKPISTEILEYSSDSDKEDDENDLFIDSESPHKYSVDFESDSRQIMDRLIDSKAKPTEAHLGTPLKETAKFPKTPENSATKKKFLRGGLAERLNGLQNRERSAISLWRHQCAPYQMTRLGRKSGVLTVKILELHEECTMQVAMCEQLAGPHTTSPSRRVAPSPGIHLKVLFTRETAGHLRGHPQDIIYIFPPWQKLLMPNTSCPVILNTYFCQKAVAKESTHEVHYQDTSLSRRTITLAQIFRITGLTNNSPDSHIECSSLTATGTGCTHKHEEAVGIPLRDSLLDFAESHRADTWSEVGVRVVVQRAYSLLSKDSARGQQGHSMGHADSSGARFCLLVQDSYGMLGEVYLESTVWKSKQLEGKSCSVAGMKVLQKATRGRTPGLFSLIDTIWPPVMPLTAPGHGKPSEKTTTYLPPPIFCYIFSVHPSLGQIDIIEGDPISKLYQPPVVHCLREVLQGDEHGVRCSFCATVIYQRPQLKNLLLWEQKEIWLLVTDVTLQTQDKNDCCLPRTLPVCVTPSCVLGPEVLEAFVMAMPHTILFRDALRDQGRIVCVERTVLLCQKSILCVPCGTGSRELTGPVMLDELDSFTPVNSICSVQGAVVGVDESTAFSWPVCDQCGKGSLEQRPEDGGTFFCVDCFRPVLSPLQKRHLQVFLDCPTRPQSTVKIKLLQSSISSLLRFAASEDGSYDAEGVLGKKIGSLLCFVQSIVTHPTSCIELEEIELLRGRGDPAHQSPSLDP